MKNLTNLKKNLVNNVFNAFVVDVAAGAGLRMLARAAPAAMPIAAPVVVGSVLAYYGYSVASPFIDEYRNHVILRKMKSKETEKENDIEEKTK